jgi:hypothetical protein
MLRKAEMPTPYANLSELLAPYFHREWRDTARSTGDVIALILLDAPREQLRAGLGELDHLLASGLCEPQLRDLILYELDCYIDPDLEGLDFSGWLWQIHEYLRRAEREQ